MLDSYTEMALRVPIQSPNRYTPLCTKEDREHLEYWSIGVLE
jgi:hypothetical protein